jgi:hypothetical protein
VQTERPPELYDGGYWYVVPVLDDEDGLRPDIDAEGWCAWYVDGVAIVRTPDPVAASSHGDAVVKPYGRIGGR